MLINMTGSFHYLSSAGQIFFKILVAQHVGKLYCCFSKIDDASLFIVVIIFLDLCSVGEANMCKRICFSEEPHKIYFLLVFLCQL